MPGIATFQTCCDRTRSISSGRARHCGQILGAEFYSRNFLGVFRLSSISSEVRATFHAVVPLIACGRVTWRRPCPPLSDATLPTRPYARSRGNSRAGTLLSGGCYQIAHGEKAGRIGPGLGDVHAGAAGQGFDAGDVELVGVLGMHPLAFGEAEGAAGDSSRLWAKAAEVDLDAPFERVVEGLVHDAAEIECRLQLAVHAPQQVERKSCGDARRVVVGILQALSVLPQLGTEHQRATAAPQPIR